MLMQHVGVGYFGYYRATIYAMKHSVMPEIAKLKMKVSAPQCGTAQLHSLTTVYF